MNVYFYGCVTLDGYLAAKDHSLCWLHQTGTAEETGYEDFYAQMDVTVMGRRTFREVEKLGDPAKVYPTTENYVFTHRPLDRDLVDHLIIQVAPVLLGAGIPLFTQREALRRLRLEAVRQYGQFAELVYSRL